jgi:hypothetical protein
LFVDGGIYPSGRRHDFPQLETCTSFRPADSTQAAAIVIGLGFVSSFFGITILSTPSLYSAVTLSPLTAVGRANDRLKTRAQRTDAPVLSQLAADSSWGLG